MKSLEIEKLFNSFDFNADAKTPFEKENRLCLLERWEQLLKNVSTEKAKVIFKDYEIKCYQDLGFAIQQEMEKDRLFQAQYHGFQTIKEYENHCVSLIEELEEIINQLGERE